MTALVVYLLAVTDVAFVGYRTAAGRNGRIRKTRYFRRAVSAGLVLGHIPIAIGAAAVAVAVWTAADPAMAYASLIEAAEPMIYVYGVYATLVLSAFIPYFIAPLDYRVLASVAIFGPLTLVRPLVIVGGAAWAWVVAADTPTRICVAVAALSMVVFEPVLDRARARSAFRLPTIGRRGQR